MARTRLAFGSAFALMAIGFTFMAGYAAQARLNPAVIAYVDLEKVFEGLDSRKTSEETIMALAQQVEDKTTSMQEELELLQAELESLEPGSDAMESMNDNVISVAGRLRAYQKYATLVLEREQANDLKATYDDIRKAAQVYADKEGIDFVVMNDAMVPMNPSDSAGTLQQIASRKFLYAKPTLDVTDALIKLMNSSSSG